MIAIIDYGLGNIASVAKAFKTLNQETYTAGSVQDIREADKLILPGMGSFGMGMQNLSELDFVEVLNDEVLHKKKPFLGICLGMQLLASEGFEFGKHKGLGFIPGSVKKLEAGESLRLPHMGWNDVTPKNGSLLFANVSNQDPSFYFAHSYHFVPYDNSIIAGVTNYGVDFVSSIQNENIFGTQFHPEKSQKNGLQVLKNFLSYEKTNGAK